ncbi:PLP-dependent aminotransferase family protein [Fodinicola acaciae]|uniref:MocR-like pyridoxine biosynthesis transcription factor PdxR n=1 Tax=Fodinicola acaciae TaxID=2681555 RepID=UPI0013D8395E|nr:PLP-dependent aminotransferase family protein [Fodinicola acaciae]
MTDSWPISGVDLHLELDLSRGRRDALEQALRAAVRDGRLAPDARLPATRRLAADLGLSRGTVRGAYDQLIEEGYLTARQGSGTVVARLPAAGSVAADPRVVAPRHDLRPGSPDATAFPVSAWLRSARRALTAAPAEAFGYGDTRGRIELRTALADYLGRTRGVLARPESIVVTSGYVQALGLLSHVLGGRIAMEDPGVPHHREVVRRNGAEVVPLPVDERGARTDLLEGVDAVVVTAAHQNPTGVTLHPARRRSLVSWPGLVIENDYDGEFRYDRQPVGAIQGMDPEHVVYLGSASKSLAPALRLGWMVLPPRLVEPVVDAKLHDDRQTETLGQLTLADFVTSHAYDRHIRSCRLRYKRRRDLLVSRLARVNGIAAGLHALVPLPAGGEATVRAAALDLNLAVGFLGDRWHSRGDRPEGLVVGYGTPAEHAYPAALDALSQALSSCPPV